MSAAKHHSAPSPHEVDAAIRDYWNRRIDDTPLGDAPPGSLEYFAAMDRYRLSKAEYVVRAVDMAEVAGRDVLEIGCGAGLDLARFARAGARVTGIDVAPGAVRLAQRYFDAAGLRATLLVADGTALPFPDASFDLVYCHGVLPFARDPEAIVRSAHRVLRIGGRAVFMVYNRHSWVAALGHLGMPLGHADAPCFRTYSRPEFERMLRCFGVSRIEGERLPSETRRNRGLSAMIFNRVLVPTVRTLPESWVRTWGWHWMAYCTRSG